MQLTPELREKYRKDGFLFYDQRILSDEEIGAVKAEADKVCRGETDHPTFLIQLENHRFASQEPPTPENPIRKLQSMSYFEPAITKLARDPRIVDVVESILGPDIKLNTDEYFMKNPVRQGQPFIPYPWHQDTLGLPFMPTDQFVTCWLALDRATPENGCMQFIPGSHAYGLVSHDQVASFLKHPVLPKPIYAAREAGYAVFHHGLNFHCSEPNRSNGQRRAIAFHYMSAKTLYLGAEDEVLRRIVQQGNMGKDFRFMLIRGREYPQCV